MDEARTFSDWKDTLSGTCRYHKPNKSLPPFFKTKKVSSPVLKPGVHTFCSSLREQERFYWVPWAGVLEERHRHFLFSKRGQTLFSAYDKGGHLLLFGFWKRARTFGGTRNDRKLAFPLKFNGGWDFFWSWKVGARAFLGEGAETFLELEKGI